MRNLVIGSGPAAAGAVLALTRASDEQVDVIDIGLRLERPKALALAAMMTAEREDWTADHISAIATQPIASGAGGRIPEKRVYGSDFPFRDAGQLSGVTAQVGANSSIISAAYGGFSNVWGAQITPFTESALKDWPVSSQSMRRHYRAVLREVPLAAQRDDLEEYLPLLVDPADISALPPLNPRFERLLRRYAMNRAQVRAQGVTLGSARLALRGASCVRCALCMTGCPYGLIYSSSQTFDRLIASGRVTYRSGLRATKIVESDSCCVVEATDLSTGRQLILQADRVFIAAGPLGSTRLALASMRQRPTMVSFGESAQFAVPFLSQASLGDPRHTSKDFTLNQVNLLVAMDEEAYSLAQVHLYPYNPAIVGALPRILQSRITSPVARAVLGRLTVGLGYLPSWASNRVLVRVRDGGLDETPNMEVLKAEGLRPPMLDAVLSRLAKVGGRLDLRPVLPLTELSGPAKSYHYGGSFPHQLEGGFDNTSSDLQGPRRRMASNAYRRFRCLPNCPGDHLHVDCDGQCPSYC